MTGMSENVFINVKNRSHTITAEVEDPRRRGQRRDPLPGRPVRRLEPVPQGRQADVHLQLPWACSTSPFPRQQPVPAGKATIRFEFAYDGGGLGKGGAGHDLRQRQESRRRTDRTHAALAFSADEGADVGEDGETPVVDDYGIPAPYKFTGKIDKVTIDVKEMKVSDKAAEDEAIKHAALKKGLSD